VLRTFHHSVSDGWSAGVFNRELEELYAAYREGRENPLKPLEVQYADFAIWQRENMDEARIRKHVAYWREHLEGIPEELELGKDRVRSSTQTVAAGLLQTTLPEELADRLKELSVQSQATLYMTLVAAFAVLLERYSGQNDIVIGSPIANRQDPRLEELIGIFVNSLVLRVKVDTKKPFLELLADVRRTTLEAYRHQDVQFERLVEELRPERSPNTDLPSVVCATKRADGEAAAGWTASRASRRCIA
jgi:hypothetical protein